MELPILSLVGWHSKSHKFATARLKREERIEATDRVLRRYEIMGIDPLDYNSEEWREEFAIQLEKVVMENY